MNPDNGKDTTQRITWNHAEKRPLPDFSGARCLHSHSMSGDELAPGTRVLVNMDGIQSGSTSEGLGGWVSGTIIGVDGADVSVQLNVVVGGSDQVVVGPDRIIRPLRRAIFQVGHCHPTADHGRLPAASTPRSIAPPTGDCGRQCKAVKILSGTRGWGSRIDIRHPTVIAGCREPEFLWPSSACVLGEANSTS